jgi:hypothetical protein
VGLHDIYAHRLTAKVNGVTFMQTIYWT